MAGLVGFLGRAWQLLPRIVAHIVLWAVLCTSEQETKDVGQLTGIRKGDKWKGVEGEWNRMVTVWQPCNSLARDRTFRE